MKYNSGDLLRTTNGNFMIVSIDSIGMDGWGAIYIDEEYIQNNDLEMQYIAESMNYLIELIENDGKIIEHIPKQHLFIRYIK